MENFVSEWKRVYLRMAMVRVAWILEPFDDVIRPTDSQMRRRQHFQRRSPTVKCKSQSLFCDSFKDSLSHCEAVLVVYVYLNVVGGVRFDQIHESHFIKLVFT